MLDGETVAEERFSSDRNVTDTDKNQFLPRSFFNESEVELGEGCNYSYSLIQFTENWLYILLPYKPNEKEVRRKKQKKPTLILSNAFKWQHQSAGVLVSRSITLHIHGSQTMDLNDLVHPLTSHLAPT